MGRMNPRDGTQRAGNELLAELLAEQRRTNELLEQLVGGHPDTRLTDPVLYQQDGRLG